jgi:hypothetical protein
MAGESVARTTVVLYDGAEQPIADECEVLLEVRNNYGISQSSTATACMSNQSRHFSNACIGCITEE